MEVDEVERTFKVVASNLGFTRFSIRNILSTTQAENNHVEICY